MEPIVISRYAFCRVEVALRSGGGSRVVEELSVGVLDGGVARYLGDGVWSISQEDDDGRGHDVILTRGNLEAMLAAN
jgi:hypothetical protein